MEDKDYDTPEKEFEKYPDVLADILNALIYKGKAVTKPEELQSAETETHYQDETGRIRRQYEDLAKYAVNENGRQILYLIANQTAVDSRMLLRKYGYVGGYYRSQYNGQSTEICPVIEIVLYWGRKRWDANRSMRRLFRKKKLDEMAWEYIGNEKLHVFEMRYLPRDVIERFTSDMRLVLEYLQNPHQAVKLNQEIKHPEALFDMLAALSGDRRYIELFQNQQGGTKKKAGGETTMGCILLDELERDIKKGIEEGIAKRMPEELTKKLAEKQKIVVSNMLKRGMSDEDICGLAECTPEFLEEVKNEVFATA